MHSRPGEGRLSPEERRKVRRAAFLRPMSLLMLAIGGLAFAFSLTWWIPPLTLLTYAALVFLAIRDPFFQRRVLEGRPMAPPVAPANQDVSPERRARWLPRGETRRKVEEALEMQRRTVFAIEESDDVTRAVLDGAIPKLHQISGRLVDVALIRQKAAEAIRELEKREGQVAELEELQRELHAADAEISGTLAKLSTLRARIVRVSLQSGEETHNAAARLNVDLDELNLRLDALDSTRSPEHPSAKG